MPLECHLNVTWTNKQTNIQTNKQTNKFEWHSSDIQLPLDCHSNVTGMSVGGSWVTLHWQSIDIWLTVEWHSIGSQLAFQWHSSGSQVVSGLVECMKVVLKLRNGTEGGLGSITPSVPPPDTPVTFKWQSSGSWVKFYWLCVIILSDTPVTIWWQSSHTTIHEWHPSDSWVTFELQFCRWTVTQMSFGCQRGSR